MSFDKLLKYYMERAKIGSEQLGQAIHKKRSTIHRWLNGETRPQYRQTLFDCFKPLRLRHANEADQFLQAAGHDVLSPEEIQRYFPPPRTNNTQLQTTQQHLYDIDHLPKPSLPLVGRHEKRQQLTAALQQPNTQFISLIGDGGEGKSALTYGWLKSLPFEELKKYHVIAWSFYSQGSHNTQTTSRQFFTYIFDLLKIPESERPENNSESTGKLLAKTLAPCPFLLILDGLEPLQYPPDIQQGTIKDSALAAFIQELQFIEHSTAQLLLINSRQPIIELEDKPQHQPIPLKRLIQKDGIALLKKIGIRGTNSELATTVEFYQGYALALSMLGYLLKNYHNGDIQQEILIDDLLEKRDIVSHIERIMQYYQEIAWRDKPLKSAFLCLIGLFDRPMSDAELNILMQKSVFIQQFNATEAAWRKTRTKLKALGLIVEKKTEQNTFTIESHPIVRAWFNNLFKTKEIKFYQQANQVLVEYFEGLVTRQHLAESIEDPHPQDKIELEYLNRAIHHACCAENYCYALSILQNKVLNGNGDYLLDNLARKIGTHLDDLTVLADFFQHDWQYLSNSLSEPDQRWLHQAISYTLLFTGRLKESVRVTVPELHERIKQQDHVMSVAMARNAAVATACLGNIYLSKKYAELTYTHACKVSNEAQLACLTIGSTTRGYAYYLNGELKQALDIFEALFEKIQPYENKHPAYINFYMMADVWYCRIFERYHGAEQAQALHDRIEKALHLLRQSRFIYTESILYANYGKSLALYQNDINTATNAYEKALDNIYKEYNLLMNPIVLIDCIDFYTTYKNNETANKKIQEAYGVATRNNLYLFLADTKLQEANLLLNQTPTKHLTYIETLYREASNLLFEMDYGLRFIELELLATRKAYYQNQPQQAQRHLANAQYTIEQTHQNSLQRQWNKIASEIV